MSEETIEVVITEDYGKRCIKDGQKKCDCECSRKPEGYVEVYETDENGEKTQLVGKSNLVVYSGREWLISHAFMVDNDSISSGSSESIFWFGVGDGGCEILNPLVPIPPTNDDTGLNSEVTFTSTSNPSYADYRTGNYYKKALDSVTYEQDTSNNNRYLKAKISATVGSIDSIGENISEAGLFTALSGTGGWAGPFHLFAHVTFTSILKTADRRLIFVWYIFV